MFKRIAFLNLGIVLIGVGYFAVSFRLKSVDYKSFQYAWSQEFRQKYKVQFTAPVTDIIRSRISAELNQVDLFLPHYTQYDENEIFQLNKYAETCQLQLFTPLPKTALSKAWKWHQALCQNKDPHESFYTIPPFIHPSGQSFVKLALQNKSLKPGQFFEALTLKEYFELSLKLNPLGLHQTSLLKDQASFVLTDQFIFLPKEADDQSLVYEAFLVSDWKNFIADKPFAFVTSPLPEEPQCLDQTEQGCWIEKVSPATRLIQALSALAVFLLISAIGIFIFYRQKNFRLKKLENEKRKFTLQLLTHELRTPSASLTFLIENMRPDFDLLPENQKENFIKICNEISRLQNMTRTSYQYLQTDDISENLKMNLFKKDGLEYARDLNEKFGNKIQLEINCHTLFLTFDWFWLDLCLQNLIRNAFEHGKGQVTLRIEATTDLLSLSVLDEGKIQISEADLFEPFKKNHTSKGLGLGLSIVRQILTTLNTGFKYSGKPQTEFKIEISREHYEYTFS